MPETNRYQIASVYRAVSVLEAFPDDRSLTQAEIARAVGLSEVTTLRYLTTLAGCGLLEREPSGRYVLGLRLFQLGERALGTDPRRAALPLMQELADRFDETVNLAARSHSRLVLIEGIEGTRSIRRGASIGESDSWHASALGKAILGQMSEEEALELIDLQGWDQFTPSTHTRWADAKGDLAEIRRRGYAIDDEEGELGLRCVGAAIYDRLGRPRYAISVSGPAARLDDKTIHEAGEAVRKTAAEISARLGFASQSAASTPAS